MEINSGFTADWDKQFALVQVSVLQELSQELLLILDNTGLMENMVLI